MAVLDLSAYKPVPGTLEDANQIANGFTAIQTCINALDNNNFAAGKIFDPAKIMQNAAIDGDPLVWDNSLLKWVPASTLAAGRPRAPRVVTSTLAGGPPASPVDQDIWVATAVDANGTRWGFQYNAGSASASKWEFVFGPPAYVSVAAGENTASAVYAALTTAGPSFTVARAGDYIVAVGAHITGPTSAGIGFISYMSYDVGATGAIDGDAAINTDAVNSATPTYAAVYKESLKTGLAAATALVAKYRASSGTAAIFAQRTLKIIPVRIA